MSRQVCLINKQYNLGTQKSSLGQRYKIGRLISLGSKWIQVFVEQKFIEFLLLARYCARSIENYIERTGKSKNEIWEIPIFKKLQKRKEINREGSNCFSQSIRQQNQNRMLPKKTKKQRLFKAVSGQQYLILHKNVQKDEEWREAFDCFCVLNSFMIYNLYTIKFTCLSVQLNGF